MVSEHRVEPGNVVVEPGNVVVLSPGWMVVVGPADLGTVAVGRTVVVVTTGPESVVDGASRAPAGTRRKGIVVVAAPSRDLAPLG